MMFESGGCKSCSKSFCLFSVWRNSLWIMRHASDHHPAKHLHLEFRHLVKYVFLCLCSVSCATGYHTTTQMNVSILILFILQRPRKISTEGQYIPLHWITNHRFNITTHPVVDLVYASGRTHHLLWHLLSFLRSSNFCKSNCSTLISSNAAQFQLPFLEVDT